MKSYRCVFTFVRGYTAVEIAAHNAQGALSEAQLTVSGEPDSIEVWDETGLFLERKSARSDGPNQIAGRQ